MVLSDIKVTVTKSQFSTFYYGLQVLTLIVPGNSQSMIFLFLTLTGVICVVFFKKTPIPKVPLMTFRSTGVLKTVGICQGTITK